MSEINERPKPLAIEHMMGMRISGIGSADSMRRFLEQQDKEKFVYDSYHLPNDHWLLQDRHSSDVVVDGPSSTWMPKAPSELITEELSEEERSVLRVRARQKFRYRGATHSP